MPGNDLSQFVVVALCYCLHSDRFIVCQVNRVDCHCFPRKTPQANQRHATMAGRESRDRRPPARFSDFQALEMIEDSTGDDNLSSFSDSDSSSSEFDPDNDSASDDDNFDMPPPELDPDLLEPPPAYTLIPTTNDTDTNWRPDPPPPYFVPRPINYWNQIPWDTLFHGPLQFDETSMPYQWEDFRRTENQFDFSPKEGIGRDVGVGFHLEALFGDTVYPPTEIECFEALFTDEIRQHLLADINNFAELKIQQNTPAQKRSRFNRHRWAPVTNPELYRYLAVITAMGVDKRPSIRDYWTSTVSFLSTPWYNQMFHRERFEVCLIIFASLQISVKKYSL